MKSYLSLIPISAKVHRRQSRMTRICIILAVFLVTSIFSLLEMWTNGQTMAMRSNHGDWHIILQNMSEDEAKQIIDSSDVAYSSWYDDINVNADQGYYINGKNAVLYGIEETYVTDIMKYPLEGSYPQNEKEVALSADAKELFNFQIGDNIILNTPAGDFNYTISGFYEDDEDFNDIIDGTCMYMCRAAFDEVRSLNGLESMSRFYVRFKNENGLKKTIANIKEQYSLTSENVSENTPVLSLLGASTNESINALYPLAVACFVIILIAGIFMISSCMNSNVAQRTKFFGMMRCIGASKQQIVRFVRLEALNWCKTAIPIGCALGTVTCWVSCAVLKFIVKGEWVDMPLFSVSINGILCGAAVGIITVFIAAQSPAKQASKVSPVAAISGNTGVSGKIVHAANTKFLKVETSLGIHHATGAKKNLILMTGSFALTIMLFLTFSACLDIVHKLLPSVSDFTPDITIASQDDSNSIDPSLAEEISEIPGIESVFGMMYSMLKQLWIVPVNKMAYFFSKFAVVLVYSVCFMLITAAASILTGVLPGYIAFDSGSVLYLLRKCMEISLLTAFAVLPILAAAAAQKGYILPVCLTLVYTFLGFILLMVNMYLHPLSSMTAIVMRDIPGVVITQPLNIPGAFLCIGVWSVASVLLAGAALKKRK